MKDMCRIGTQAFGTSSSSLNVAAIPDQKFASLPHLGVLPGSLTTTDWAPPVYLGVQQRVSVSPSVIEGTPRVALFYNRDEFDDVLTRFCSSTHWPFQLDHSACDYIFSLTSGHPGAVAGILSVLRMVCLQRSSVLFKAQTIDLQCRYILQIPRTTDSRC